MSRTKFRRTLTAEILRELLDYDPDTGVFRNRIRRGNRGIAGAVTGTKRPTGYVIIGIEGLDYYAHRLAWLYVHGEWPKADIDHIDGDPSNNRIHNLRDVSTTVNCQNHRGPKTGSQLGVLGVHKHRRKYIAWICINKKKTYLGLYETPEMAHAVYLAYKRAFHEGCTI